MLALARQLRDRFYGLNANLEAQVDAAVATATRRSICRCAWRRSAAKAALTLGALFDEADAFCRNGDLLTLAESDDVREFRTWYIEEVVRQLDGGPPIAVAGLAGAAG